MCCGAQSSKHETVNQKHTLYDILVGNDELGHYAHCNSQRKEMCAGTDYITWILLPIRENKSPAQQLEAYDYNFINQQV